MYVQCTPPPGPSIFTCSMSWPITTWCRWGSSSWWACPSTWCSPCSTRPSSSRSTPASVSSRQGAREGACRGSFLGGGGIKDEDRREGKSRRCCLGDDLIQFFAALAILHQDGRKNMMNCTRTIGKNWMNCTRTIGRIGWIAPGR